MTCSSGMASQQVSGPFGRAMNPLCALEGNETAKFEKEFCRGAGVLSGVEGLAQKGRIGGSGC